MRSFTPGPWVIDEKYLSEVQTSSLLTVATCWHEHTAGQTINVTGVLECSLEESAANARLIAAAPDLLEAAKRLVALEHPDMGRTFPSKEDIEIARAAIAKAEGRP